MIFQHKKKGEKTKVTRKECMLRIKTITTKLKTNPLSYVQSKEPQPELKKNKKKKSIACKNQRSQVKIDNVNA